ncbi:G-protein coupled receptor dmsr-1-like [Babylonia areolata]|uniref:G-protein coupled receptor dmsr-1-like n=1 Tax=Babylonia areolata TaxID=304850 RepID=UPI003FD3DF3A
MPTESDRRDRQRLSATPSPTVEQSTADTMKASTSAVCGSTDAIAELREVILTLCDRITLLEENTNIKHHHLRDKLHLTRKGTSLLAGNVGRAVRDLLWETPRRPARPAQHYQHHAYPAFHQPTWYLENNVRCSGPEETMSGGNYTGLDSNLSRFSGWYAAYHGYVSLCVCLSGIVTNTFNVTVLTRRKMRTPVNQILTGLAFSDIITMMSYVPFALHFYCLHPATHSTAEKNSYGWMFFLLFHINLTNVTHTISIWLCVVLAIVRYLHIRSPTRASSARFRRITQAKYLVMVVYVCSTVVMIPNYLTNELKAAAAGGGGVRIINESIWVLKSMRLGSNETETLVLINVWQYAVLAKLAPCFLMSVFGSLLLHQMRNKINQRRDFLKFSLSNSSKLREHSRTTKMLITVIVLFIVTELPQGVLIVLSATQEGFFNTVYLPLGDVMDIMALVNNAINFVLYCSMSTKFRETFLCLYCACRHYPRPEDDHADTQGENGYVMRDKGDSCCSNNN